MVEIHSKNVVIWGFHSKSSVMAINTLKKLMDIAQDSFISSFYWIDRVGPVASISIINKMKNNNFPNHLCKIGYLITEGWKKHALEHEMNIQLLDVVPPLTTFFDYGEDSHALHTLLHRRY
ncbi:MAG: hypothetical protein SVJ22_07725 [Halobacteriota archaeon]|nr:hypothetical protein [Halobacteriota archaeon]